MRNAKKYGIWKYFHRGGGLWAEGKYLPKTINSKTKIEGRENIDLLLNEKYIRTGKWNFYNHHKELIREVVYKFYNNKYTCKITFEVENKEL